jgi:DNA-binding SARP family transcriptional activator
VAKARLRRNIPDRDTRGVTESGTEDGAADLALEVFEQFPYGVLVVDGAGRLLAHNAAAEHLLQGRVALDEAEARVGCELLGCRRPDGPLADLCLHEHALSSDGPLPELRIDLAPAPGASTDAAWVTVAALRGSPDRVLMELRPGNAGDRRRRTDPHWTAGPRLRISVLGRTRVHSAEGPIEGRWLANRPGQILKYLVSERHRTVYADEIVEKLWPNATMPSTHGLRYFVHVLRDQLEPERAPRKPSSFVQATRGGYVLDRGRVWIDASEFEDAVAAGTAAEARGDEEQAIERLTAGLALYGGDFLADEPYAEWAFAERDRLRQVASEGLRTLAGLKQRRDDLAGAAADLERLSELEPFDVDVYRELLLVLLRRGRRTEAVRRYTAFRHRMLTTFGEELDFTLADVALAAA